MDPLSDFFTQLEVTSAISKRLEASGAWAVRFQPQRDLKFNAVLRGRCWITLAGKRPLRLEAGDTYLLADTPSYVLSSDPAVAPVDAHPLFARARGGVVRLGGDDTALIGGSFAFAGGELLLDALPHLVHIPAREPAANVLRATLQLLADELVDGAIGASLVTRRLADIALVQALRAHVAAHPRGWLGALADPRVGAALRRMHADVRRAWAVDELARIAGMSRSGFALRFKQLVGDAPLAYLTRWRMLLAREALRGASVAEVAARVGYASESAFGHAFKRAYGSAPKRYWGRAM